MTHYININIGSIRLFGIFTYIYSTLMEKNVGKYTSSHRISANPMGKNRTWMSVCAVRLAVKAVTDITGGEKLIHNGITKMAVCHFKMKGNLRNDQQKTCLASKFRLQRVVFQMELCKILWNSDEKKAGCQNVYYYDICLWMAFCRVLENCWTFAQWLSALSIERKMEGSHLSIFWQLGGRHQVANPSGFEIQSDLRKSSCSCLWRSST